MARQKQKKRSSGTTSVKTKKTKKEKEIDVQNVLYQHGERIYDQLVAKQFPSFDIPSRSINNIRFDEKTKQYILGDKSAIRHSKNPAQLRAFTQLIWLAYFADKLTREKKSSTLRDVYYSSQADAVEFENQQESDGIIVDLEAVTKLARENFYIFPEERSTIFGDLNIEYTIPGYEGKPLNLANHPDGYAIGPSLTTADLKSTSAEVVIAIEKGGLFTRFVEEKVDKKFNAIIVNTGGQAPRSTRTLLRRLRYDMNLPVIILTDGDVYGEHIAMVIKSGSANAAHLRDLNVPDAKWVGVWATDIVKYDLPTIPMTESDIKRCHDLIKDPRYAPDTDGGLWRRELDKFVQLKRKAELEAFTKYGLTNITDEYLPVKMAYAKTL